MDIAEARLRDHYSRQASIAVIQKAAAARDKARDSYRKAYTASMELATLGTGTGRKRLVYPSSSCSGY